MSVKKVLMTGATGYIADQLLPTFREKYEMVLLDVRKENRRGEPVDGAIVADLIDPDRTSYAHHFDGVDAVVHLAYKRRAGEPLEDFFDENQIEYLRRLRLRRTENACEPGGTAHRHGDAAEDASAEDAPTQTISPTKVAVSPPITTAEPITIRLRTALSSSPNAPALRGIGALRDLEIITCPQWPKEERCPQTIFRALEAVRSGLRPWASPPCLA